MTEFNNYLLKYLKNIAFNNANKQNNVNKNKSNKLLLSAKIYNTIEDTSSKYNSKESSNAFYDTTVNSLNYKKSSTFFTLQFEKELQNILCPYSDFKNMSSTEKKKIQDQLWNLSLKEFEWKVYNKRLVRDTSSNVPYYFKTQFKTFQIDCEHYINPTEEQLSTKRAYKNYFNYKTEIFLKFIFEKLIQTNNFNSIINVLKLTSCDYNQIIKNYIDISDIFNDILKTSIKLAHDNLFNNNFLATTKNYNDSALVVHSNYLRNSFQLILAMNLINATLNYCNENKLISIDILEISKPIQTYLMTCQPSYATHKYSEWGIHCDNSAIILDIFEKCGVFTNVVLENKYNTLKNKPYVQKILILPMSLDSDVLTRPLKFPNIIKPKKIKISDVNHLIKPIVSGERHVVISKELVNCLNYSCSKINKILFNIRSFIDMESNLKLFDFLATEPLDIGFLIGLDINKQRYASVKVNTHTNRGWSLYLANYYKNQIFGNTSIRIVSFNNLLRLSGNTGIESVHYLLKKYEYNRLHSMK